MRYNPEIHHRRSIRLRNYDYSQAGAYFVTICTQNRECLFGNIPIPAAPVTVGADPRVCPGHSRPDHTCLREIRLTDSGRMVQTIWHEIPDHYPGIEIDEFVVMPNHVHGIVFVIGQMREAEEGQTRGSAPTGTGMGGLSLPEVVQRYKTLTTKRYVDGVKQNGWPPFPGRLWQRNYWECVIRDEAELHNVREYIQNNPARWEQDDLHPGYLI